MNQIILALQSLINGFKINLSFVITMLGILWFIQILNYLSHYKLNIFGIWPRRIHGLIGIICSPFLHGNFEHLFVNSIPLFVLINLLLFQGKLTFYIISITIIIISGFAVWVFGRRAIHVGASGLIMGYFGYLLTQAWHHPTAYTILLAVVCLYYFGSLLIVNLLSAKKGVSWEGHILGFFSGILTDYLFPSIITLLIKITSWLS